MKLTPLTLAHAAAIRDFVDGFSEAGEDSIPAFFARPAWSHAYTVEIFDAWSRGERVDDGFVATTTRFLESDGVLLGVFNFRHTLTDRLEKYGGHVGFSVCPRARRRGLGHRLLAEAKALGRARGLNRILVTCAPDNLGSRRIIEGGGGVLQDVIFSEEAQRDVCRFWIDLSV